MKKADIIKYAMEWSNGDPELCAEIAVGLDRLFESAYAEGFKAAMAARTPEAAHNIKGDA